MIRFVDQVRAALRERLAGQSLRDLGRECGIHHASLHRFARGQSFLGEQALNRLAAYLRLRASKMR